MFHMHEASCGGHFYGDDALIAAFPIGWSQAERDLTLPHSSIN
jgi:hypothetical protein